MEEESTVSSVRGYLIVIIGFVILLFIAYLIGNHFYGETHYPWWKGQEDVIEINQGATYQVLAVSNGKEITQVNGLPTNGTACDKQNGTRECSVAFQSGLIVILQPFGGGQ